MNYTTADFSEIHGPDEKPVRAGIYQRIWPSNICWCRWDGKHWHWSWSIIYADGFELAEKDKNISTVIDNITWRGLNRKP